MRLKKTIQAADEELLLLINKGYEFIYEDGQKFYDIRTTDSENQDSYEDLLKQHRKNLDEWAAQVKTNISNIFPTQNEWFSVFYCERKETGIRFSSSKVSSNYATKWQDQIRFSLDYIEALKKVREKNLKSYKNFSHQLHIHIEEIDSFSNAQNVKQAEVQHLLKDGFYDVSEDFVQKSFEEILQVPDHREDWAGESNDLYTRNLLFNGFRIPTAFMLKGNGLKKSKSGMRLSDCGKNGDQIVRLFNSPAELFVIQYVGNISDAVIKNAEVHTQSLRSEGKSAYYCIINGQDTARLLHAYNKAELN